MAVYACKAIHQWYIVVPHLFSQEGGFVRAVSGRVPRPSHGLHVWDGHAQDGEFVWLPGERAAGGHHVRQLCDVQGHLITPAALNLTVVLSGGREEQHCHH